MIRLAKLTDYGLVLMTIIARGYAEASCIRHATWRRSRVCLCPR